MSNEQNCPGEPPRQDAMLGIFGRGAPKIFVASALLAAKMPMLDAALLSYVGYHITMESPSLVQSYRGEIWLVQKMADVAAYLGCPLKTLEKVSKRLRDNGFLETAILGSERRLAWKVNGDNLLKRIIPSYRGVPSPQNGGMDIYKKNKIQNIGVSKDTPRQPAAGGGDSDISSMGREKATLNVAERLGLKKPKKEARPDEYVEFWNSLPDVPKSYLGSQAYELCRNFFRAYQNHEIGTTTEWILPNDYKSITSCEDKQKKKGKTRTRDEIFEHARIAARAFDPKYFPKDKKGLKKLGLKGFLYNSHAKYGQSSAFMKFVDSPPLRLDDTRGIIESKTSDDEAHVIDIITEIYCFANDRDDIGLNDDEFLKAEKIANSILKKLEKLNYSSTFHYKGWDGFLKCWKDFCVEELSHSNWQMPITALYPGKDMWRKFTGWIQQDCHLDGPLFDDDDEE